MDSKQSFTTEAKSGIYRNGFQTEFYNRETLKREDTAKLDKEFYSIISLADGKKQCQCSHTTNEQEAMVLEKPTREPLQLLNLRMTPHSVSWHNSTSPQSGKAQLIETVKEQPKSLPPFEGLDSKLYPEFTRTVTISSSESKSIQFRNQSYIADVKRILLNMYLQRKRENTQEPSCPSDLEKNSVATSTSPIWNNSLLSVMSDNSSTTNKHLSCNNENEFNSINFVPIPSKSTKQFLEETIGPGSSCKNISILSEMKQIHQPPTSPQLPNYYQSPRSRIPKLPSVSPTYSCTSMAFDNEDDIHFNRINCFLPLLEENSPEFHHFPRKMF